MIRGAINYLYLKYPEFGFKRKPVQAEELLLVLEREGVDVVKVTTEKMAKVVDYKTADKFVAYLSYGEDTIDVSKPTLFINDSSSDAKKWFGISHELGHFLMHRFIDNVYERDIPITNGINGFRGRIELEADLFANHVFMPDIFIEKRYGDEIRKILTNGNSSDLKPIFEEVYSFCIEYCSDILEIEKNKIHSRALLVFKLRASRFISGMNDELVILNHDVNNPYNLSLNNQQLTDGIDVFEKYLDMCGKSGCMMTCPLLEYNPQC